jgi:UDP-N-acetyl-D-mannosaminuronate dehydrogenase
LLGLAYKPGVKDARESPAVAVAECLVASGAVVTYTDSHLATVTLGGEPASSLPLADAALESVDVAVVLTAHPDVDYTAVLRQAPRTFDATGHLREYAEAVRVGRLTLL